MFDKAKHTTRHDTAVTCKNNVFYVRYKRTKTERKNSALRTIPTTPIVGSGQLIRARGVVVKHPQLRIADKWGRTN